MQKNILLLASLLTGCQSTIIITKKDESTNRQLCQLKETQLDSELLLRADLSLQKDQADNLTAWIKFTPKSTSHIPLEKPQLIFKIKAAGQPLEKITLLGEHVTFAKLFFNQALNKLSEKENNKDIKIQDGDRYNDHQLKIAQSIWPYNQDRARYAFQYHSGEHAVLFPVSSALIKQLMAAHEIEILIQTDDSPLKLFLKEKQIQSIKEFKATCAVK